MLPTKCHWGAFAGTDLEQQLKSRGVDTVVLTGISTNAGVEPVSTRILPSLAFMDDLERDRIAATRLAAINRAPSRLGSPGMPMIIGE
jgi:isochorismate hydrolase